MKERGSVVVGVAVVVLVVIIFGALMYVTISDYRSQNRGLRPTGDTRTAEERWEERRRDAEAKGLPTPLPPLSGERKVTPNREILCAVVRLQDSGTDDEKAYEIVGQRYGLSAERTRKICVATLTEQDVVSINDFCGFR